MLSGQPSTVDTFGRNPGAFAGFWLKAATRRLCKVECPSQSLTAPPMKPPRQLASQTLFRGLELVDAVADGVTTLPEISARLAVSVSTAHRLASALVQVGYLRFEARKGYSLGPHLIELGFKAHRQSDLATRARPHLQGLADLTHDTVHLATMLDDQVVYLDKIAGSRAVQVSSLIGGRKRLCSTGVGKALLLDASEQRWTELYRHDAASGFCDIRNESVWLELMRRYVVGGFAFDLGEDDESIRCVAAPIRDASRQIVGAVSVSSTVQYMEEARMQSLIDLVQQSAACIGRELGG